MPDSALSKLPPLTRLLAIAELMKRQANLSEAAHEAERLERLANDLLRAQRELMDRAGGWLEEQALHHFVDIWVRVDHCAHPVRPWTREELCTMCSSPATHKIGDEGGPANFHNLTAYVCCACMKNAGMDCILYPWFTVEVEGE